MCKRIVLEGICGYKERCAYNHKIGFHVNNVNDDAIQEDVKNLKTEVENLKNTIKFIVCIRQEFDKITNSVKDIKKEINMLKAGNKEVEKRIKDIEEDLTDESDEESDIIELKCCKCEFYGKTSVQLKKHKNTKHATEHEEAMFQEEGYLTKPDYGFEGIEDMFEIEIIDGEQVYACNICNEGFDQDAEVKKHIEEKHNEIIQQITKDLVESEEMKCYDDSMTTLSDNDQSDNDDSEDDEAFLARFDEDGNCIE